MKTSCRLLVLLIMFASTALYGAAHQYVAVVDLTSRDNKPTLGERYIVIPSSAAGSLTTALAALKNVKSNSDEAAAARKAVKSASKLSDVRTFMRATSATSEAGQLRGLEAGDDFVTLYVVYADTQFVPELKMEEKPRSTQFAEDFKTLINIALAVAAKGTEAFTYRVIERTYAPGGSEVRSTMKFDVATKTISDAEWAVIKECKSDKANAAECAQFDSGSAKADVTVSFSLMNGPVEHGFISADLPVTRPKDVTYDSTGHALAPSGTPSQPHIGFNYMVGDVRAAHAAWYERFFGKALVQMSKHPRDSFGAGIGYRFPAEWKPFGFQLDHLSLFTAYMRSRTKDRHEHNHVRLGVSFNLDKALSWAKGGK